MTHDSIPVTPEEDEAWKALQQRNPAPNAAQPLIPSPSVDVALGFQRTFGAMAPLFTETDVTTLIGLAAVIKAEGGEKTMAHALNDIARRIGLAMGRTELADKLLEELDRG